MSKFTQKFQEIWAESFGDNIPRVKDHWGEVLPVNALEADEDALDYTPANYTPPGIGSRIFNTAVLLKQPEGTEAKTPLPVEIGRYGGAALGALTSGTIYGYALGGAALAAVGSTATGFGIATVAPALAVAHMCILAGGAVHGLVTKPEEGTSKLTHVIDRAFEAYKMPLSYMATGIQVPISVAGFAAHAFDTATKAYMQMDERGPSAKTPAPGLQQRDLRL